MIFIILGTLTEDEKELVNKIFIEYQEKLYNTSMKILRSHSDAEDALSQTFLNVIDNIDTINRLPCPEIAPYCVVIVKNASIDILRQQNKTIYAKEPDSFQDTDALDIEDEFVKSADRELLRTVIDKLSAEDKFLIQLRFANEMSFSEIAELLGISEETAKKRGQRILKKLYRYYVEEEESVCHI